MAYKQVRANKGAPGIDQQTFKDIENKVGISEFLANVRQRLIDKEYKPKPDGSKRPLGIPVIEDRVVQVEK
jgi:RNA-directed DNA polymerase